MVSLFACCCVNVAPLSILTKTSIKSGTSNRFTSTIPGSIVLFGDRETVILEVLLLANVRPCSRKVNTGPSTTTEESVGNTSIKVSAKNAPVMSSIVIGQNPESMRHVVAPVVSWDCVLI